MKKILFAALFVLVAAGVPAGEERISVPLDDSPSRGPSGAPVTIVEFIDFQ